MMIPLEPYVQQGKQKLRALSVDPKVQLYFRAALWLVSGFVLSAASLKNAALPLGMALVFAATGWSSVLSAAGSCLGYLFFGGITAHRGFYGAFRHWWQTFF